MSIAIYKDIFKRFDLEAYGFSPSEFPSHSELEAENLHWVNTLMTLVREEKTEEARALMEEVRDEELKDFLSMVIGRHYAPDAKIEGGEELAIIRTSIGPVDIRDMTKDDRDFVSQLLVESRAIRREADERERDFKDMHPADQSWEDWNSLKSYLDVQRQQSERYRQQAMEVAEKYIKKEPELVGA